MMELKLKKYQVPDKLEFNYEELKAEIVSKLEYYTDLVYSDAEIKEAKADKAKLNKLKKALNDERIKQERIYLEPFNEFKKNINEIIDILDKPIKQIDIQIKEYDSKQKAIKRKKLEELFDKNNPYEWLEFNRVFDVKWLNASVSLSKAEKNMIYYIDMIRYDIETINELENAFEVFQVYKKKLNLNEAIAEGNRIKEVQTLKSEDNKCMKKSSNIEVPKQKHEVLNFEKAAVEEEAKAWIGFKAYLSIESALELKEYFNSRNIKFQPIEIMED